MAIGYTKGRKHENDQILNKKHILVSACMTILFIVVILLQQLSVGNIGPKSDSKICSEFCSQKGYHAISMPTANDNKEMCRCFNNGHDFIEVPFDTITK
jgi:hypothetical protein